MNEGSTVNFENFYAPSETWFEYTVYPSADGITMYARDVTERKRAEEALRESEERFRRYFELGLIGMAITSPAKGILEATTSFAKS